jgi:alkylation response protein AidB-like acyl-CoA dehydrogenase
MLVDRPVEAHRRGVSGDRHRTEGASVGTNEDEVGEDTVIGKLDTEPENESYDAFDSFGLNESQLAFRRHCHDFAATELRPRAAEHDRSESVPWDLYRRAAEAGFYRPEFFYGAYLDPTGVSVALAAEELSWGDAGLGLALLYPALPLTALLLAGTAEQQEELVPLLFGTPDAPSLSSFAASEPQAGSDLAAVSTTARRVDGGWVLNGTNRWAGNTGDAAWYLVVATVDPALGARGQALFALPGSAEGVSFGPRLTKLGLRALSHRDLFLNEVHVPDRHLIGGADRLERRLVRARTGKSSGEGGQHTQSAMATFEATRPFVAAMAVGVARAAHEHAVIYSRSRESFGKVIGEHQQIASQLARQRIQVDAGRLLVHRAVRMQAARHPMAAAEGSQAKLFAGEAVREVTLSALQVAGGLGFTGELPLERLYRDAPIYGIFEGTNEIQNLVIASALLGRRVR